MQLAEAYIVIRGKMDQLGADLEKSKKLVDKKLAGWENKLKPFEKGIRTLSIAMIGMGTAATGAITGLILQTTRMGDALDKMSKRTGLSTETLSQLGYAAKISGTDIDTMEASLKYLSRAMDDVSKGMGESKATFEKLGIQVTDTDGTLRSVVDILLESGDAINKLTSETEKVAAATDLFGRRGGDLVPLLREGSAGMTKLMERADELGLTISGKSAAAAAEFNDRLTDLRSSIAASAYQLGSLLLPTIQKITVTITEIVSKISQWTKRHSVLTSAFLHLAAVVGPMLLAGGMFGLLITQLGSITAAVKVLGATFTWFAAHPAVAIAGAITMLIGGLVLYTKHARDAKDVTDLLGKSQADLMSRSTKELEITLENSRKRIRSLDKELEKQRMMQTYWEDVITRAEKSGDAAKYEKDRLLEVGKKLREISDEYNATLGLIVNLKNAMEALGQSTGTSAAQISAQAKALKELKASLPKKEDMPAFLEAEPPIPDIEKLRQFVEGADVVAGTSKKLREDLEKYQKRIKMGEPEIPFKRFEEMRVGFQQMRERDLKNQKAMAESGAEIREQELQDAQDNQTAFWALMETWRQADLSKIVAYNESTEQAELDRQANLAKAYEKAMEDRIKAIDMLYQYEIKASEDANKKLIDGWDELVEDWPEAINDMVTVWEGFSNDIESSFAWFAQDFLSDISNLGEAWNSFCNNLKQSFIKAIAEAASKTLMAELGFNALLEAGKAGGLSGLIGAVGGLPIAGKAIGGLGLAIAGGYGIYKLFNIFFNKEDKANTLRNRMADSLDNIADGTETIADGTSRITENTKRLIDFFDKQPKGRGAVPRKYGPSGEYAIEELTRVERLKAGWGLGGRPRWLTGYQMGGISRQPTLAWVSEGGTPEAHVPLQGGKIPVDIRGDYGGNVVIESIDISFPNADIANLDQANFERRFRNHITTTMRNMARDGTLNKAVVR